MKLIHKDLRFFPLWKQRIEILLCHRCACTQTPWTALFLFGDGTFSFSYTQFFIEAWCAVHLLTPCCSVGHHCTPTPNAFQPRHRTWFRLALSSLTSHPVFGGSVFNAPTLFSLLFPFHWCACLLFMLLTAGVYGVQQRQGKRAFRGPVCSWLRTFPALWTQSGDGSVSLVLHILTP